MLYVGLNYRSHILETGRELPEYPRAAEAAREHTRLIELLENADPAEVERYARWHKLQTVQAYRARRD